MSRFNPPTLGQRTTNLAGASAYSQDPRQELVSHEAAFFGVIEAVEIA